MTFRDALAAVRRRLEAAAIPDAALEAEVLLMYAASRTRDWLYAGLTDSLSPEVESVLERLIARRLHREPLAYITGHREFFGLDLFVDRRVLIPRPETETVVEQAIAVLRQAASGGPYRIADVGTGSGAIAIALVKSLPNAYVYAADISRDALAVAEANVRHHGVEDRVKLLQGDLLTPVTGPLDLVVANLPYVAEAELPNLQPEIRLYEPRQAVIAGPGGLEFVNRLIQQTAARQHSVGHLVLELQPGQARDVGARIRARFPQAAVHSFNDLGGLERGVVASLAMVPASAAAPR